MRLDKFLCEVNTGSRSLVKEYIKQGHVTVNGAIIKKNDYKIMEESDIVSFQGNVIKYKKYSYYMLNKPAGYITATEDKKDKTVMDLLINIPEKNLSPLGRLDKDTVGLLIITNNGELGHQLLSPKYHVEKTYLVHTKNTLSIQDVECLETGVTIGEDLLTLPAKVVMLQNNQIHLTIQEGKFHQIKRMLKAVNNEVIFLKRISFGDIQLDEHLEEGQFRELTAEEIDLLMQNKQNKSCRKV